MKVGNGRDIRLDNSFNFLSDMINLNLLEQFTLSLLVNTEIANNEYQSELR